MNGYKPPLTGHEKRPSGMQRLQDAEFRKSAALHERKLKSMKSGIDTSPPRSMQREGMSSRQHNDLRRKVSIAEDNFRLLQRCRATRCPVCSTLICPVCNSCSSSLVGSQRGWMHGSFL